MSQEVRLPDLGFHLMMEGNRQTQPNHQDPTMESKVDGEGARAPISALPNVTCPMLIRPDLSGPFDASVHTVTDFNFTPIPATVWQPWVRRVKPRNKRAAKKKRSERQKEGAQAELFPDTTDLSPMSTFKTAASLVPVRRSPRKRIMLEPSAADEDHTAEFEDVFVDPSIDLWDAKASIRNHLLKMSPGKSAATKRRVNGHERNWLRAHKLDPDVKYLMQFPGEMPAEKARDLIMKRDMLSLDPVEEADGSLIMPTEALPEASHTSEASRMEKLEMAATRIQDKLASIPEEMPSIEDGEWEDVAVPENMGTPRSASDIEPREQSIATTPTAGDAATTLQSSPGSSASKRRYTDESLGSPRKRRCSAPSPQTPRTPQMSAPQEIVDVDLHEQPDIFSSTMPKRHQEITPAMPAQPSWVAATTPRPPSSPTFTFNIDVETSVQWSPLDSTPANASLSGSTSSPAHNGLPGEVVESPTIQAIESAIMSTATPAEEVGSAPSTPSRTLEIEEQQEEAIEGPGITITVETCPEAAADAESPPQAPAQDDDRTYLLQFMNKHHAVKSKVGAMSPGAQPALRSPAPQVPAASPSAAGPRTPDAAPIRMWIDAPEAAEDGKTNGIETPIKPSASKKRTPLSVLDTNSPSPVKARVGKRKLDDEPTDDKMNKSKDADKESAPEPSPKRRRGLRARKPVAPSTPIPANARAIRSGEKDLASLTRANTRANKGNSVMPEEVLERFAADPMGQKWKERKEVVDAKAARAASAATHPKTRAGKNVRWAQTLAQFREGSPAPEEEDEEDEKVPEVPVEEEAPQKKQKVARGKQAPSVTASSIPKTPPKSKLPAPVSQARRTAPATPSAIGKVDANKKEMKMSAKDTASKIGKPRSTRAAAQKSNLNMGLTATGTPIRRGRGRPKAAK